MEFIILAVGLVVGAGFGVMGYRSMLKRDPAKLEEWAAAVRAAKAKAAADF